MDDLETFVPKCPGCGVSHCSSYKIIFQGLARGDVSIGFLKGQTASKDREVNFSIDPRCRPEHAVRIIQLSDKFIIQDTLMSWGSALATSQATTPTT